MIAQKASAKGPARNRAVYQMDGVGDGAQIFSARLRRCQRFDGLVPTLSAPPVRLLANLVQHGLPAWVLNGPLGVELRNQPLVPRIE